MLRVLLLAAVWVCGGVTLAQDTEAARITRAAEDKAARELRLREALDSPTQMNFPNVTLQDGLDFLSEYHKVKIVIDKKALADAGVDLATSIDIRVSDIPLASGLNMLLGEMDLTWLIANDVIAISTHGAAAEQKSIKVYAAADLAGQGAPVLHRTDRNSIDDLAAAVALVLEEEPADKHAATAVPAEGAAPSVEPLTEEVRAQAGHDLIVRLPQPDRGAATHPRIRPFRGNLVVKASFHEHERIRDLLEELRANRANFPSAGDPALILPPPTNAGPNITEDPTPGTVPTRPLPIPVEPKAPIKIKPVPED